MARDLDTWKKILHGLDPLRELRSDEVDALYVEPPDSASGEIAEEIHFASSPTSVRMMLAGARGSGKTTQLLRLFSSFERVAPLVTVPIYLDVARVLPEQARTQTWLPLLAAAVSAVREQWCPASTGSVTTLMAGAQLGGAWQRLKGSISALAKWVKVPASKWAGKSVEAALVATGAAPVAPMAGVVAEEATAAALAMIANPAHTPPDPRQLIQAIQEEIDAITQAAGVPPLLLLDGLDKRPSLESVMEALDEAELLYPLRAALVVSGPMQLSLDPRFAAQLVPGRFRCVVHHNLPVVDKEGRPKPVGTDLLLKLFQRRWEAMEIDGPAAVPDELVREAARWSSGVVREFLEIVRLTCRYAYRERRVVAERQDLDAAIRDRRMDFERTVTTELWDLLEKVKASHERPRADVDELLFTNRVACYPNDGTWFRPNELLIPHLEERKQRRARDDA